MRYASLAFDRAVLRLANTILDKMPMIAITTKSSTRVNPRFVGWFIDCFHSLTMSARYLLRTRSVVSILVVVTQERILIVLGINKSVCACPPSCVYTNLRHFRKHCKTAEIAPRLRKLRKNLSSYLHSETSTNGTIKSYSENIIQTFLLPNRIHLANFY